MLVLTLLPRKEQSKGAMFFFSLKCQLGYSENVFSTKPADIDPVTNTFMKDVNSGEMGQAQKAHLESDVR